MKKLSSLISFRLPVEHHEFLQRLALSSDKTVAIILRELIKREYVNFKLREIELSKKTQHKSDLDAAFDELEALGIL